MRVFFLFILLASAALLSCQGQRVSKDYGDSLQIGIFHQPTAINPLTTDSSISANLLNLLFDPLIRFTSDGDIQPALAKQWEISRDLLSWTFHLRDDVRFQDGTPLTALDVKFTYDAIRKKRRVGYLNLLKFVREVRVIDRSTIQILLSRPDRSLWAGLSEVLIAPKHLLEKDFQNSHFNQHPIGSGPYQFVKQNSEEILLKANEDYFEGRPYLDLIAVKILPNQPSCLNHLVAGEIDMIFLLNPEDYGALSQIPTIKIYDNWFPLLYMLTFNMKNALFAKASVRQALNLAIDREELIQRVLHGKGLRAAVSVHPEDADYDQALLPYPHRPQEALAILNADGWKDRNGDFLLDQAGKTFEFSVLTLGGDDLNSKTLQLIQQQLRDIGIKMNIVLLSLGDYVERVFRKRDFEAVLHYFVFRPFYDNNFSLWHSSQIANGLNYTSYRNRDVDRFLEEARLHPDPKKRRDAFQQFQKALHDDPPGIFLFWRNMPIALHKRFRGVHEKRMVTLRDLIYVWVPKEEQRNR